MKKGDCGIKDCTAECFYCDMPLPGKHEHEPMEPSLAPSRVGVTPVVGTGRPSP